MPALRCTGAPPCGDNKQNSQVIGGREQWLLIKLNGMQTALDEKVRFLDALKTHASVIGKIRVFAHDARDPSVQHRGTGEQNKT